VQPWLLPVIASSEPSAWCSGEPSFASPSAFTLPGSSTRPRTCGASAVSKLATTPAITGGLLYSLAAKAGTTITTPIPSAHATDSPGTSSTSTTTASGSSRRSVSQNVSRSPNSIRITLSPPAYNHNRPMSKGRSHKEDGHFVCAHSTRQATLDRIFSSPLSTSSSSGLIPTNLLTSDRGQDDTHHKDCSDRCFPSHSLHCASHSSSWAARLRPANRQLFLQRRQTQLLWPVWK